MMELSELTVRPAFALPKDFDGVVFFECENSISRRYADRLGEMFRRLLPNAKCMILDDSVRLASIESENK